MASFLEFLKTLAFQSITLGGSVCLMTLGPVGLFFLVPLKLFKDSVALLAKVLQSDQLGEMVEHLGPVIGTDGPFVYDANTQYTVIEVDAPTLSLQKAREFFSANVLSVKDAQGKLFYPELQSTLSTWMGYLFWKPIHHFNIKKQIFRVEDMGIPIPSWTEEEDLEDLITNIGQQEWKKRGPLWQIIIVSCIPKKYFGIASEGQGSIIIWRCHHLQNDGVAIANLLFRFLNYNSQEKPVTSPELTSWQEVRGFVKAVHYVCKIGLATLVADATWLLKSIQIRKSNLRKREEIFTVISNPYPLNKLKHIKHRFSAPDLSSVMMAGLAGAYRRLRIDSGLPVRERTPTAVTLPMPNHPLRLINYAAAAATFIPTGEPDLFQRLKMCYSKEFEVDSEMAQMMFQIGTQVSNIPFTCIKAIRQIVEPFLPSPSSVGLTNMRYTAATLTFDGAPIVGMFIGLNTEKIMGQAGGMFLASYREHVRFTVSGRGTAFESKEEVRRFADYCIEEWENLYNYKPASHGFREEMVHLIVQEVV